MSIVKERLIHLSGIFQVDFVIEDIRQQGDRHGKWYTRN